MAGHMFKVIDSPSTVRWYLVSIDDVNEATVKIRSVVGDSVELDSRPMTDQVFEFVGMKADSIQQWVIG